MILLIIILIYNFLCFTACISQLIYGDLVPTYPIIVFTRLNVFYILFLCI